MTALCSRIAEAQNWPEEDEVGIEARIAAPGACAVFVRGPIDGAETGDVAVVLRELERAAHGHLAVAMVRPLAERAVRQRLGVTLVPAVAWVGRGRILASLERMHDWSDYAALTEAALAAASAMEARA